MRLSLVGLALGPARPAEEGQDVRRDPPPLVEVEDSYRVGMELVVVEN